VRLGTVFCYKTSFQMNTWVDPLQNLILLKTGDCFLLGFGGVAFGPFVGIFVTRISKGRTMKEVIVEYANLGLLFGGSLFYIDFW